MTVSPTRCPHHKREIYRHDRPGTEDERMWWRCLICGLDTVSESWPAFDAAAGCADWRRGRCGHERCAALIEDERESHRRRMRAGLAGRDAR